MNRRTATARGLTRRKFSGPPEFSGSASIFDDFSKNGKSTECERAEEFEMVESKARTTKARAKTRTGSKAKKRGAGRPEFEPTAEQRERVEILVGGGMSKEDIAAAMLVAVNTLKKHFAKELKIGRSKRRAEVLEAMFNSAKGGNVSAQKAYIQLNALADADEAVQNPKAHKPAPKSARIYKGKKEIAQEEALSVGGAGSDWGTDLDPTAPPAGAKAH
ncbi:hypothetical protein OOZ54_12810 [Rhodopseudomonas palustris]|uniref:hypothetical protein n=1 Tax=Rhodopseudomonas palustris TaxID=1076 RepID=UPI0022F13838|nr:hypothetical protein [Rhodopseudomonas palustris]WBU27575.1 hypothetical protein OOZ54_12810 [Rhodopseudomonas palustris]